MRFFFTPILRKAAETPWFIRRIRDNQYDFPPEKPISAEARDLIQEILTVNPS